MCFVLSHLTVDGFCSLPLPVSQQSLVDARAPDCLVQAKTRFGEPADCLVLQLGTLSSSLLGHVLLPPRAVDAFR